MRRTAGFFSIRSTSTSRPFRNFPGAAAAGIDLDALRAGELIDYAAWRAPSLMACAGLRAFRNVGERRSPRRVRRATAQEQGERLLSLFLFRSAARALCAKAWPEWPEPWRHPTRADLQQFREAERDGCEFHEFMQWVADRQLQACKEIAQRCGMSVGLYVDLAVGIASDTAPMPGASRRACSPDVSVGAPPDEFNPAGQDWGLAPFNPARAGRERFRAAARADAIGDASCRRDQARSRAGSEACLHDSARECGDRWRLCALSVRAVAAGDRAGEPATRAASSSAKISARCRRVFATRWRAGVSGRYRVMLFERERERPLPSAGGLSGRGARHVQHARSAEPARLAARRMICAPSAASGSIRAKAMSARAWAQQCLRAILARASAGQCGRTSLQRLPRLLAQTPSRLVAIALDDILGERRADQYSRHGR